MFLTTVVDYCMIVNNFINTNLERGFPWKPMKPLWIRHCIITILCTDIYVHVLVVKVIQSAFPVVCLWALSDIHEFSGFH